MQIKQLIKKFDELQLVHGDKNFDAVYGAGEIHNPKMCLVFMNPTGRNVSSSKKWTGLKAPWIGTKNVWKMFFQLGLFGENLLSEINRKRPEDGDYEFAERVYSEVKNNSVYITNLSKATQIDARHLGNNVFREYLDLFRKEIDIIQPSAIITFGGQVSSVLLGKDIRVSDYRKKCEKIEVNGNAFRVFPVHYPVGQGTRNMGKAREDIDWIMRTQILGELNE